jgi:hypothetical protein
VQASFHLALGHVLASTNVPINFAKFHPIPAWMTVFVAATVLAIIVGRWAHKVTPQNSRVLDTALDVAELALVASWVTALASTQLIGSVQGAFLVFVDQIHVGPLAKVGVPVILFGIAAFAAWRYASSESFAWAFLFGIALLSLTASAPIVDQFLTWFINNVVAGAWNFLLALVIKIFSIHFTVQ